MFYFCCFYNKISIGNAEKDSHKSFSYFYFAFAVKPKSWYNLNML